MKPIYNIIKLTIPAGQTSAQKSVNVDPGERVFVLGVAKPIPAQLLDLGLYENSTEIHPAMDIGFYDGGIGSFEQRSLPLAYQGGSEITAKANIKTAEADDVQIELVFLTYQEQNCY